ncbi:MAG: hypothetical protein AMS15_05140 [Planctomycetes bacterium DG_23]|nr:MAG: hypothetical protein AMS15_05140 [Planctomycetes bacterium DG_23]
MLNWLIFAFVLVFLYASYRKGLLGSVVTLFSVFFATLITLNFFEALGRGLAGLIERIEPYSHGIAFLFLFLLVYIVVYILSATFLIERFQVRQLINGLGGLFFGFGTAFLMVGVLTFGWMMMPAAFRTLPRTTEPGKEFFFEIDQKFIDFYAGVAERIGGGLLFKNEDNILIYIKEESYEKKARRQRILELEEK